jgi:hypothetical protein
MLLRVLSEISREHPTHFLCAPADFLTGCSFDFWFKHWARTVTDRAMLQHPNLITGHDESWVTERSGIKKCKPSPFSEPDWLVLIIKDERFEV